MGAFILFIKYILVIMARVVDEGFDYLTFCVLTSCFTCLSGHKPYSVHALITNLFVYPCSCMSGSFRKLSLMLLVSYFYCFYRFQVLIQLQAYFGPQISIADLAQNRYFEDEAFIGYLKYLQYWQRPEYIKFIM